jgi:PEGA domain
MPSFNMPSVNMPSFNIPGFNASGTPVRVESIPAGAEASIGAGAPCKTPCTLSAPSSNGTFNVTVSLTGYQPQTIPVRIATARESWDSADAGIGSAAATTIDPDPVIAELTPAPGSHAAPAARKKPPAASIKPAKKPVAAAAAPTAPAAAPPTPAAPPMPTAPASGGFGPPPAQQPGVFR